MDHYRGAVVSMGNSEHGQLGITPKCDSKFNSNILPDFIKPDQEMHWVSAGTLHSAAVSTNLVP
jgi:alpha-tubulin suppressor-like RCC1 family protein